MTEITLKIIDGPDAGREFPVAGVLVIGRDPSAGIVLADSEVSRRHASISASDGTAVIEDLGSTNGTFMNGERISDAREVGKGDKVRVGRTVLAVERPLQPTAQRPVQEPQEATRVADVPGDLDSLETVIPDPDPDRSSGPDDPGNNT